MMSPESSLPPTCSTALLMRRYAEQVCADYRPSCVSAGLNVVVIPRNEFSEFKVPFNGRRHRYISLRPWQKYRTRLLIAPHHCEAWLNIDLLKLALYCRAQQIELVAIGHENQ